MEEEAKKKKELKELLNAFIDGDLQTPPLCTAATKGNVELVVALMDKLGADKNFQDEYGDTPLINAANKGHLPVVKTLLAAGANVNITNASEHTALHAAADMGFDGIVGALLEAGAKTDARDEDGDTPVWGWLDFFLFFWARPADVPNPGDFPMAISTLGRPNTEGRVCWIKM